MKSISQTAEIMEANLVAYEVGDDGQFVRIFYTSGVCKLVGLSEKEYSQTSASGILAFAPEEDKAYARKCMQEAADTGKTVVYSHRLITKDNVQKWVNVKVGLVGEHKGKKIILVELFDNSALAEQYEQVLNHTECVIYVVERNDFELLYANKAACTLFELKEGEYVGQKCYKLLDNEDIVTDVDGCWAQMALVSGKEIIVENPRNGDKYKVLSKPGVWGNYDAIFVYLTECTKELERERQERNSYRRTFRSIISMNRHAVGSYQINLTKGLVVDGISKHNTIDIIPLEEYESFMARVLKNFPYEDEKRSFMEIFDRESLVEAFQNGETTRQIEHSYYIEGKVQALFSTTITMVKNPATDELEGIIYSHDVSGVYLERKLKKLLFEKNYELVYLILIGARRLVMYNGLGMVDVNQSQLGQDYEYEEGRQFIANTRIVSGEKESFLEKTDLSHIIRTLKSEKEYSFVVRSFQPDGKTIFVRYNYVFLDDKKDSIICICRDITEEMDIDEITGFYNRKGFIHQTEDILRMDKDGEYAVLYFDINHFKVINEHFGIDFGDDVLKTIPKKIKGSSLKPCVVARLEADAFAALVKLENLDLNALHELCTSSIMIGDRELDAMMGCGIYMVDDKSKGISGMLDRALLAKEYIEDIYVKSYSMFDSSMRVAYMAKNELANDISSAFKNNEFEVYYQPIFRAKERTLCAAEALVRWNHPSRGIISPTFFIPNLEESGQITEVDFFVANKVKDFIEERYAAGKKILPIDVNLTWLDFYDREKMDAYMNAIRNSFAPKELFSLEITESTYNSTETNGNKFLEAHREMGGRVLMDDFGSGYSSFSTLNSFEFDLIKLDMGFIKQIGKNSKTEAVIECVIDMAHKLGTKVVAEGVETEEQLNFLVSAECDYIQGYYFAKPMSEVEFARILDET